jgi:hypothetical protein
MTMNTTLDYILANALAIIGLWAATAEGMLLNRPAALATRVLGPFLSKPVATCPACMASVWAALPCFIHLVGIGGAPAPALWTAFCHGAAVSGVCGIAVSLWNAIERTGRAGE